MPLVSHPYRTPSGQLQYTIPKQVLYREVAAYVQNGYEVIYDPDDERPADVLLPDPSLTVVRMPRP